MIAAATEVPKPGTFQGYVGDSMFDACVQMLCSGVELHSAALDQQNAEWSAGKRECQRNSCRSSADDRQVGFDGAALWNRPGVYERTHRATFRNLSYRAYSGDVDKFNRSRE
jgi:hypothetical protein